MPIFVFVNKDMKKIPPLMLIVKKKSVDINVVNVV